MTERELIDRLIHVMTQRHTNWSGVDSWMQAFMNRAADSCMKDCVNGGFGFEAVAAVRAWEQEFQPPDYREKVTA